MNKIINNSDVRAVLMRKLMTICPLCGKLIFGRDIDFSKLDKSKINHWPVKYTHKHSHNQTPEHSLTLFIDANYVVRAHKISTLSKFQK
ncbi:MAG: hypothetical protein ACTSPD_02300 [Promethearchaeota archaeon]